MKYYSELLDKLYDDEKQLKDAESIYIEKQKKAEEEAKAAEATASKRKKELANAVEKATKDLEIAEANLEAAKDQVKALLEESNKKMADILNPAKEAVKKANQARYNAIYNFNKEFGAYTYKATLDDINKKYRDSWSDFSDLFKYFFT